MADYDAIVVGAGFSGVRTLWELGQLGLKTKAFEAGADVGGVWYWNRYPGARTDSEGWVYSMDFAPGTKELWHYSERYPAQGEVQQYIGRVADKFDLRKLIQFNARVTSAVFDDAKNIWAVTTADGQTATARYFFPATGPLSIAPDPPFAGLKSFQGRWLQTSSWPAEKVDFAGKRVAVVGTGATGVQIIPKIAPVTQKLTVFQRTANYVLPGRNYNIDEFQEAVIKNRYEDTWAYARRHPNGLAMYASGKTAKTAGSADEIRRTLDAGWECGGFHFQFETYDDLYTDPDSNKIASDYIREKIHTIVKDQKTADLLSPTHAFLAKRPPCGHFYYEAFNLPQVELVDISKGNGIEVYEKGIRTADGKEYEFDIIIFALGFDAGTGALRAMNVQGAGGRRLNDVWDRQGTETFAGVLVPGFPNMFVVCGPHIPFGNMPVVLDLEVAWIGKTLRQAEAQRVARVDVSEQAARAWTAHLVDAFGSTLLAQSSRDSGAWFVGANIPGKSAAPLFYFGGVPQWHSWLDKETQTNWASLVFSPAGAEDKAAKAVVDKAQDVRVAA